MQEFANWDAFKQAEGTDLGVSQWHWISQDQVDQFADVTGDHQWIHVDTERAINGPYGGTIAHGFLTLSLLPILLSEIYVVQGLSMALNYGLNRVRFPQPLLVGARVQASAKFLASTPVPLGFQVTLGVSIVSDGTTKPVCVAETLALMAP